MAAAEKKPSRKGAAQIGLFFNLQSVYAIKNPHSLQYNVSFCEKVALPNRLATE